MSSFLPASLACFVAMIGATALAETPNPDPTKPGYTTGDLLMGFRVTGGTGAGQCYVVNIGAAATYRNATSSFTVANLGNIGTDLLAYSATWQTRADLNWGIAGSPSNTEAVNGDPIGTVYVSRIQTSTGVPGTPPSIPSETNRIGVSTRMTACQSGFWDTDFNTGTPGVAPHTANSTFASFQGEGDPYAWRTYMATGGVAANTPGNTDFGAGLNIEANANRTLSLFRMSDGNAASYEGYFAISATGVLTFTPPLQYSTWAATNVNGQPADGDFDGDGMQNGIEFFIGGSSSAFDMNPQVVNGSITWPRAAGRESSPVVEVSTNLVDWTTATSGVSFNSSNVTYTLPEGQPTQFVRLKTTP